MSNLLQVGESRSWGWLWVVVAESRQGRGRHRRGPGGDRLAHALELTGSSVEGALLGAPEFGEDGTAQALLTDGASLITWTRWLSESFHPAGWTWGVGFGEVEIQRPVEGPAEFRGEAFERARGALWQARRQRRRAFVQGPGGAEEKVLASLLEMMEELRRGWTARQAEIVRLARVANGRKVAARLGIGPSVVSESLTAASFRSLRRAENSAAELADCFGSQALPVTFPTRFPALTDAAPEPSPAPRAAIARA